jgi:hypothetical protein
MQSSGDENTLQMLELAVIVATLNEPENTPILALRLPDVLSGIDWEGNRRTLGSGDHYARRQF